MARIRKPSAQTKRRLRARFDNERTRTLARGALAGVIATEIAVERLADLRRTPLPPLVEGELTAVIKTFERPRELRRLVRSIQRVQPDLPILVVDDSRAPIELPGVEVLRMPFNSGISVGRNAALQELDTPYFLLLDDDFAFYRHTALATSLATIRGHPDIDILGGEVVNLPDFTTHDYSWVVYPDRGGSPRHPHGSEIADLPVRHKVPNFFIGRTETVRRVGWTEELKVMEHNEFFTRAHGVLTTVSDPRLRVLHAKNPFDRNSPERAANQAEAAAILGAIRRGEWS
jgi:hypothetical protein